MSETVFGDPDSNMLIHEVSRRKHERTVRMNDSETRTNVSGSRTSVAWDQSSSFLLYASWHYMTVREQMNVWLLFYMVGRTYFHPLFNA